MKTNPLVSVIIVNWNGKHWLEMCLPSLAKVRYSPVELIIVDNASNDGSVEWVKKRFPKATVIRNEENLGFSHANNLGYKQARGEYILFLNNDTRVTPDFIDEFLKPFHKDKSVGGAQSKILLMDEPHRLDSIGAFLTPTGFLFHNHLGDVDSKDFDREIDLYTVKGASMMFRADILKQVEVGGWLFDPDYFAYFEETDLCHRIWLAGYRIVYAYKSVIYHKMGATSSKLVSAWVQFHSYKNRINSELKNFSFFRIAKILPVHLLLCQVLAVTFVFKGSLAWALAIERAIWWNIIHFSGTLRKRRYIQSKIRKVSDMTYFPLVMKSPGMAHYMGFLRAFLRVYRH